MSNIVTGRQLRAARILAGLTQKQLAQAVGVHERAARYWELKENKLPTSTLDILEKIEAVLRDHGVIVFSTPTAGVRLASNCRSEGNSETENKLGQRREQYLPSGGNTNLTSEGLSHGKAVPIGTVDCRRPMLTETRRPS
jgi:transcriptional regulator with XRE-family HTH domain